MTCSVRFFCKREFHKIHPTFFTVYEKKQGVILSKSIILQFLF
ncbi:hypothetical protein JCM37172_01050 [Faecalimonas hominis]